MIKPSAKPKRPPTLDQTKMPFLESLMVEKHRWQTSFHMPGHKGVMSPHPMLLDFLGGDPHPADLVEINGIIDYLHSPKGALLEAQQLASEAYGADTTFFLINGSTVGNVGSLMSASSDGQSVIMNRASHRSVYGGVVLSGAMPVYLTGEYHPQIGFPLAVSAESVLHALQSTPNASAVHITSPNYYGVISDTLTISEHAHTHGAALLVDEAHGSHLGFHEALPLSATYLGADMVIQSTHKTQGALTQASMLHVNNMQGFVNVARVGQVLSLLQSSSPSSLLLASLDAARHQMATQGRELLEQTIALSQSARESICEIEGLWCYGDDLLGKHGIYAYDPTKLIIRVADLGMTGFEAYDKLRYEYGIDGEFADVRQVICSITIGDTAQSVGKLVSALRQLAQEKRPAQADVVAYHPPASLPKIAMSPRDAYYARSKAIPLAESAGQVIAENIIPYPPGIPLLVPGEVIDHERLEQMAYLTSKGSGIVGMEDKTRRMVRVVTAD